MVVVTNTRETNMTRLSTSLLLSLLLAVSASAAPTFEAILVPEATYPTGVYEVPAVAVPTGYSVGYIRVSRDVWLDPETRAEWTIFLSQDAGSTWTLLSRGSATGGIKVDPRTGLPNPFSKIGASLPQPANTNRRVKATVTISGGPITTTISAELR